jgi:pimeloyl-ACP methyl ester carboxylesterase
MQDLVYTNIATKSGNVGYVELGHGVPLILLVGYSGTLFHWNKQFIEELSKHFTLYLLDNRKVGLSDSNNPESILGFAQDVVDFVDAKGLNKPLVFGWSMGGVIAQELARSYGNEFSGAIFLSTVPQMRLVNPEFMLLTSKARTYTIDEFRAKLYHFFFSVEINPDEVDIIKANALAITNYQYRFTTEAKTLQEKVIKFGWDGMDSASLSQLTVPQLYLWAKDDMVVPKEAIDFFSTHSKAAKTVIYPRGGHFLIHMYPSQIARDIANFFDEF